MPIRHCRIGRDQQLGLTTEAIRQAEMLGLPDAMLSDAMPPPVAVTAAALDTGIISTVMIREIQERSRRW